MRVALVHDYLTHFGGAERVLAALMQLFPNAPVFTLVYDPTRIGKFIDHSRIRTSLLQKLPGTKQPHRYLPLAFMPITVENFDLNSYDVVLSASHSFSKGIIINPQTLHISYCFTPTRYAWDDSHRYVREFAPRFFLRTLAPLALSYIRLWDYYAAQRVHKYITLSNYVARRIRKYYNRTAIVIAPPVNLNRFEVRDCEQDYYLIVSRLVPYKRIELAIDACEELGRPLRIIGIGPEEKKLKRRAGKWTSFLGFVPDSELPMFYQSSKALLFPQEEDFGITTLEAAASGRPTIAFQAGGALETIVKLKTGLFFNDQNKQSLKQAILAFEMNNWDSLEIRKHAEGFNQNSFMQQINHVITQEWDLFKQNNKVYLNA